VEKTFGKHFLFIVTLPASLNISNDTKILFDFKEKKVSLPDDMFFFTVWRKGV